MSTGTPVYLRLAREKTPVLTMDDSPFEIGRARTKEDALAGLDRWRARHQQSAAYLEPADVLVDAMRGRYHTWTRIRVNLQHVPIDLRPSQEALDPDEGSAAAGWPDDGSGARPKRSRKI